MTKQSKYQYNQNWAGKSERKSVQMWLPSEVIKRLDDLVDALKHRAHLAAGDDEVSAREMRELLDVTDEDAELLESIKGRAGAITYLAMQERTSAWYLWVVMREKELMERARDFNAEVLEANSVAVNEYNDLLLGYNEKVDELNDLDDKLADAEGRADAGDAANEEALKLRKDNTRLRHALDAAVPDADELDALLSGLTND